MPENPRIAPSETPKSVFHRVVANGNKYVGEFRDDNRHGQGTYTYASGGVHNVLEVQSVEPL